MAKKAAKKEEVKEEVKEEPNMCCKENCSCDGCCE
jgi:hypothetical protein